jgi:hypothetical protein
MGLLECLDFHVYVGKDSTKEISSMPNPGR